MQQMHILRLNRNTQGEHKAKPYVPPSCILPTPPVILLAPMPLARRSVPQSPSPVLVVVPPSPDPCPRASTVTPSNSRQGNQSPPSPDAYEPFSCADIAAKSPDTRIAMPGFTADSDSDTPGLPHPQPHHYLYPRLSFCHLGPLLLPFTMRVCWTRGPCTTHPYMLWTPRDLGVNSLPLYNRRGHSHLGSMGCTMAFY